jgi:methylase of polypeptide subunit release factors
VSLGPLRVLVRAVGGGIVSRVELPDVGALALLAPGVWQSLGERLRAIGVDARTVLPQLERMQRGQAALVKWALRRREDPVSYALRMFVFGDGVPPDAARTVLGSGLGLERLLEAGLLRSGDDGAIVSCFQLAALNVAGEDLRVFSDDLAAGGDAVMGPSQGTVVLANLARPRMPTARALDVGCGAGTVAMAISPTCDRVVATDTNPRALTLARINCWMNGIVNVELRLGDLMAPVEQESFDVIASQPPFVPWPDGLPATGFLFGGPRGDEVPLRLLGQVASRLVPGGVAVLLVGWPIVAGDPPLLPRLRAAAGPLEEITLLLFHDDGADVAEYCASYGAAHHAYADEASERDVIRYLEHFERHRIRSIVTSYLVLRRGQPARRGWTSALEHSRLGADPVTRERVDALLAEGDRRSNPGSAL